MKSKVTRILIVALFLGCIAPLPATAGFRISPMRIDLERSSGSGSITIANDEEKQLSFQVSAVAWTQDESGKDVYSETGDLVFFPRIMVVEKGGSQVIRVGAKSPAGARERSYRLYLRGLESPVGEFDTPKVAIELRMGIPVFLQPVNSVVRGEINGVEIADGRVRVLVHNVGAAHFKIEQIQIDGIDGSGREIFSEKLGGWYLLSGATRRYETPVPEETCLRLSQVRVTVKTDTVEFKGAAAVETGRCRR